MAFNFSAENGLQLIKHGIAPDMSDEEFILKEIQRHKTSKVHQWQEIGKKYYQGEHDILRRQRTAIGAEGQLVPLHNLPNNRLVDNQYAKLVVQKANYLVGRPFSLQIDDPGYSDELSKIFDRHFQRLLNLVTVDALNCGCGWIYVYYDDQGELAFQRMDPLEIIPGWRNDDKTELDYVIRCYTRQRYTRSDVETVEYVEVYDESGVYFFELVDDRLKPVAPRYQPYTIDTGAEGTPSYNWTRIPLIPWRYNAEEIPLIKKVKSLQDALNALISDFQNNMEENIRNTVLVIHNYDGEDLSEFRSQLNAFGAVKVDADGGIDTLQVEVSAANYESILRLIKQAIVENGMGFDAKDDRLAGNPNQLNIMSMYSDIDLDANAMETEYQAAFHWLLWFVDCHLANRGLGDFEYGDVEVVFNRDLLLNESESIDNIVKSAGILSEKTLVSQHPWVTDTDAELERLAEEREAQMQRFDIYRSSFEPLRPPDTPVPGADA